jgi:hypothetical protein
MNFEEDNLKDPEEEADFNSSLVDDDDDVFDDGIDTPLDIESDDADDDEVPVSEDLI